MSVLINKEYKQYDNLSRYEHLPFYYDTITEKYIYGTGSWLSKETPY